ncbi:MAG TPA: hypothetical protein VK593_05820 [Edaphobacter sp.]|nr:hypothetical protein [Edaphobacter sp.]
MATVSDRRQQRRFLSAAWIVALLGLILLIVALGAASHHVVASLCIVLFPIFLFAVVEDEERRLADLERSPTRPCEPERPSLFQRPPPLFA